jgi:hypothetical protein
MIQSAFHRPGDPSRRDGCPPLRFASARSLGLPVLRASTTTSPFVRFLPLRYDREHDPFERSVPRCSGRPCRAHGPCPVATNRQAGPDDFRHPGERRAVAVAPVLVRRNPLRSADESERASRADDERTVLANDLSRRHGPRAPSRGSSRTRRAPTRRSLEHLLVTGAHVGVWRALPRDVPAEDTLDVSRPAKGTNDANASRCFRSSITRSRA